LHDFASAQKKTRNIGLSSGHFKHLDRHAGFGTPLASRLSPRPMATGVKERAIGVHSRHRRRKVFALGTLLPDEAISERRFLFFPFSIEKGLRR
jgi:hypothetical protein